MYCDPLHNDVLAVLILLVPFPLLCCHYLDYFISGVTNGQSEAVVLRQYLSNTFMISQCLIAVTDYLN